MAEKKRVRVFAPATTGNVGPGFDVLGLAIEGLGDVVEARRIDQPGSVTVQLVEITGVTELEPSDDNTACVAARHLLSQLDADWGVELRLEKGLPLGSGLGSSGASAAAAAAAVNLLAGSPLAPAALLDACAEAERSACGSAHRDNVGPALLGGVVIVRPGGVTRIRTGLKLGIALVTPQQELPTRRARETIPAGIPLAEVVHNSAQLATLVYALATDDVALLREAIDDRIAEPRRASLIPGFDQVKKAALEAGALGASISGAGPSIFALCEDQSAAEEVAEAMSAELRTIDQAHMRWAATIADQGAHEIPDTSQ